MKMEKLRILGKDYQLLLEIEPAVFNLQFFSKKNRTIDLFSCTHEFFRRWIRCEFTGITAVENCSSNWTFDQIVFCSWLTFLKGKFLKKCLNLISSCLRLKRDNALNGFKVELQLHLFQVNRTLLYETDYWKVKSSYTSFVFIFNNYLVVFFLL